MPCAPHVNLASPVHLVEGFALARGELAWRSPDHAKSKTSRIADI